MTMNGLRRPYILLCLGTLILVAARCGSDPNIEGAKFDLENKDYDRALENIAKAIEKDPANAEALVIKGEILQEVVRETTQKDERALLVEEMVDAYHRSVMIDPSRTSTVERELSRAYSQEQTAGMEAYRNAQHLRGSEERREAFINAAALFNNASLIFPDSIGPYLNEATAYYGGDMLSEAVGTYEAALGLGHTSREVFVHLASVIRALALQTEDSDQRSELFRRAVPILQQGLEHHADDAELRDMLANFYSQADMPEEAVAFFESQYDSKREDKFFLHNYGTLLLREQDYVEAAIKLLEAVRIDSTYITARFNLGAALINEGVNIVGRRSALADSLEQGLPVGSINRAETRLQQMRTREQRLFRQAIEHLEIARRFAEDELEPSRDICRALYRAYGYTNQRSKAEAIRLCAEFN